MCRVKVKLQRSNIGTFNVRGLAEQTKKENLVEDLKKYDVKVCSIQETKIAEELDYEVAGYRFLNFKSEQRMYGNGFVISPAWKRNVYKYWRVSDRIAVLQLSMDEDCYCAEETGDLKLKITRVEKLRSVRISDTKLLIRRAEPKKLLTIINVYAPQTGRLRESVEELEAMYSQLDEILADLSRNKNLVFIAGDMNAKVGRVENEELNCIGKYGRGHTNNSGSSLIEFCDAHSLFLTNTAFKKSARHVTTWESTRMVNDREIRIFNQIDYIICHQNIKKTLLDARSFNGTLTYSDHRIVISSFDLRTFQLHTQKKPKADAIKFNARELAVNEEKRIVYREDLSSKLRAMNDDCEWNEIVCALRESANKTLDDGYTKVSKSDDSEIRQLSVKQKELRLKIENTRDVAIRREKKHERNLVLKEIRVKQKQKQESEIDRIAEEINNASHSQKMYKAVKYLRKGKRTPISVIDEEGKRITNTSEVARRLTDFYRARFHDVDAILSENDVKKPLNTPITIEEVKNCLALMSNGKAPGFDGVNAELLKYGPPVLHRHLCRILNEIFCGKGNKDIGKGVIVPINKPGKARGVLNNFRPVTLLSSLRKLLSLITIKRIQKTTEEYLDPSQSAYRPNRSTTDIVWTFRWMLAKVQKFQIQLFVTGIDMSAAFDTINRAKLLEIYEEIANEDENRLVKTLLTNTTLQIQIPGHDAPVPFNSNVGSPQGDGVSGINFDVYLENALRSTRDLLPRQEHDYTLEAPNELVYADDVDFLTGTQEEQAKIARNVGEKLAKFDLKVNSDKTELTILARGERPEERWRKVKKLGSLLGDEEDIIQRKNLASAALGSLQNLWRRSSKISLKKRLQLYNSLVKPILLYNCETWGLSKTSENQLNSFHRRQLRRILNIRFPNRISNVLVYEKCRTEPISRDILERRWRFFGHILRRPENIPAWKAMKSFFDDGNLKKFRGRPRTTIVSTLNNDIKCMREKNPVFYKNIGIRPLERLSDLKVLKDLANNRPKWRNITECMYAVAKAEDRHYHYQSKA